ncbi:MAG: hypothetical protein C5B47_02465 [Verrucomicrobia bacterium]|nr:MAG: hypothetical protein C5B47_02465 [Verrucomicrobiota bacterium]
MSKTDNIRHTTLILFFMNVSLGPTKKISVIEGADMQLVAVHPLSPLNRPDGRLSDSQDIAQDNDAPVRENQAPSKPSRSCKSRGIGRHGFLRALCKFRFNKI